MVLSYHNIAEERGFYTLSEAQFEEQLHYLKGRYDVVSVPDYVDHIYRYGKSREGSVVITFDDGFKSYSEIALPLLEKMGMPSALFVCTGYLGRSNEWNEEQYRSPIMDEQQLKEVARNELVTIGAHTVYHPELARLQRTVIQFELGESKAYLESLLNRRIDYVAYPYGQMHLHVNQKVLAVARSLEYRGAFSTNYDIINTRKSLYKMNRVDIAAEDDLDEFILKLQPANRYYEEQRKRNRRSFRQTLRALGHLAMFDCLEAMLPVVETGSSIDPAF